MPQQQSSQLKDLRPGVWGRARLIFARVDRRLHLVDGFFSFLFVFVLSLMVQEQSAPQTLDLGKRAQEMWEVWLAGAGLWTVVVFLRRQSPKVLASGKDVLVAMGLMLTAVASFKLTLIFQMDIVASYFVGVPTAFFLFLIPAAAPSMILRLLQKSPLNMLFGALHALCMAFLLEEAFMYGLHVFVASLVGTLFIARARTRSSLHFAGLKTALACGLTAALTSLAWSGDLPIVLVPEDPAAAATAYSAAFWCFLGGAVGGWISSVIALTLTPLFENLLDYTTDLKLLELARMDHPLLKELVMKAPGTYHHSIIVGSLCEAAAESIGANSLLARVAAYYHDVGKIHRANYFVENQTNGQNPHDGTKPHLSAKIIISHVREGRQMAEEHKLGREIIDFIMQHHGRSLVTYFLNKAKQEAAQPDSEMSPDEIVEEDFRYPGPNPQTKETAIMALADSCEAATRSLVDPTPARIEAMVQKIINKALNEGLLDEADITLREIRLVSRAFVRILMGLHHSRVEYPDQERGLPSAHSNLHPGGVNVTPFKAGAKR